MTNHNIDKFNSPPQQIQDIYRIIVESADYPISAFNSDGRLLFTNTAGALNFKATPEQITGKTITDLFGDQASRMLTNTKRILKSNKTGIIESQIEIGGRKRWYRTQIRPIKLSNESTPVALVISHDITDRKLIESDLMESEEKYRTLVEGAGEPIFSVNSSGKFHFMNDIAAKQLNGKPEQFVGKTMWDLFPKEHADRQAQSIARVIKTNQAETIEGPTIVKGQNKWYRTNIQPLTISDQKKLALVIAHDISAYKQAEEALRLSEQRYKLLIENLGASVTVFDGTGQLILLNDKAAENLCTDKENLLGTTFYDTFDPDFAKIATDRLKKIIETGQPSEFEDYVNTHVGKKCFLSIHTPLKDQHGNISSVQVVSHDITERKAAENALKENQERYKFLSDVTSEGILIHENNVFVDANKMLLDIFGYTEDELKTFNLSTIVAPEYRKLLNFNITTKNEEPYEVVGTRKDGKRINLLIHAKNMIINGKECRVASIRDITKEKNLTKELENHKDKLLQTLRHAYINYTGAIVAHQLNQPLTVINMLLGQIKNNIPTNDSDNNNVINQIDQCISESNNAAQIMSKFRNSVRNPSWDKFQSIKPYSIAQKIMSTLQYRAELKKLKIIANNLNDLHEIQFNENALEQIFFILMQNSIEAANGTENKTLVINGQNLNDGIQITFTDDCGGINPEYVDRIFEPFFTTKENKHGMGLGLEIIHRILMTCNGNIKLNNTPGKGAEFIVSLPAKNNF